MHATLGQSQSINRVLKYHENKVRLGKAELIGGENFVKEPLDLSFDEKLFHYNRLIDLKNDGYKPVLHIFLGFSTRDQLDNRVMSKIAKSYMEEIGYSNQPWLVYRHRDTLHPHVHVVSTIRQADGTRKPLTLQLLKHSREVTHRLEKQYGLDQGDEEATLRARHKYLQKVEYGNVSLRPAIKMVLETIVPAYRYTNLEELNAVLGLFNVRASRGLEGSKTYEKRGLVYYPLLSDGRDASAYFKASSFPSQPTLAHLEERFAENVSLREAHRRRLTSSIDYALAGTTLSYEAFRQQMVREQISVVTPREGGRIWYVDHRTQAVFEGMALGPRYVSTAVQERCLPEDIYQQQKTIQAQEEAERQSHRMRHSL